MQRCLPFAFIALAFVISVHADAGDSQTPEIAVVALNAAAPADVVAILTAVYRENPDVIVEALPKMKCIAIRANKDTTKEIRELLGRLEKASANGGKSPIKILPIKIHPQTPRPTDLAVSDEDNCPAPGE